MNKSLTIFVALSLLILGVVFVQQRTPDASQDQVVPQEQEKWLRFQLDNGQVYQSQQEEMFRYGVFLKNLEQIEQHNKSGASWTMGVTCFSDLESEEFMSLYSVPKHLAFPENREKKYLQRERKAERPVELTQQNNINWVSMNMVGPVMNQGSCNAGYAFSSVGAVQSLYAIQKSVNVTLSTEQVIQCSSSYQNNGCSGGSVQHTLDYVIKNPLCTAQTYPFISQNGQTGSCNTSILSQCTYGIANENSLDQCENLNQVIMNQPVTACLYNSPSLQNYNGGTFAGTDCSTSLNVQCMLVVGVVNNTWYLQNSWGTNWGVQGYIYVASGNTCGICNSNQQPQF